MASNFSLNNFRSEVLGLGLARTNRFEVEIPVPRIILDDYRNAAPLVSLFCEETNFPPLLVNTRQYRIFGPALPRPVSAEYGGEGISMTFHIDRNMFVKRFFEEWIYSIVGENNFLLGYQDEYTVDIMIKQLDDEDNVTYRVKLIQAFPKAINLVPLNNTANNQTHRLTVMFAYRYWSSALFDELSSTITYTENPKNPERTNITEVPPQ